MTNQTRAGSVVAVKVGWKASVFCADQTIGLEVDFANSAGPAGRATRSSPATLELVRVDQAKLQLGLTKRLRPSELSRFCQDTLTGWQDTLPTGFFRFCAIDQLV